MYHKFYFSFFSTFYIFIFFQLSSNVDFSPNIPLFALTFLPYMPRGIIFHMRQNNLYFAVVHHLYVDVSFIYRAYLMQGNMINDPKSLEKIKLRIRSAANIGQIYPQEYCPIGWSGEFLNIPVSLPYKFQLEHYVGEYDK